MEKEAKNNNQEAKDFRLRVRERYPSENPANDSDWDRIYNQYMVDTDAEIGKYKEAAEKLNEMCMANPEFAELIHNLIELKMPLRVAIAKLFSADDLIPQEGDEDYDAYKKAYEDRLSYAKRRDEQGREIEGNEQKSIEEIDIFCEKKGLSDEKKNELIGIINDHFTELLYKRISPSMLEGFFKQMTFDAAVIDADKAGEIRGRNQQIEAKRSQENKNGDGLPNVGGGGNMAKADVDSAKNFFDIRKRNGI